MPIIPNNPFKGRQHPGELIVLCVRLYLRYPLSYEHVTELVAERGVEVDASCIWRWVQAYAPEWVFLKLICGLPRCARSSLKEKTSKLFRSRSGCQSLSSRSH
jgi:hypothetical protein